MVQSISSYLNRGIWRVSARKLPRWKLLWIRPLRIIILSLRQFGIDQCMLRASALTYYSLLSIVPVLAMAFGIAKGFGLEKALESRLRESVQGQEQVVSRIIEFANAMLDNTRGGLIAGIGVALLFWTVVRMLTNIERSFNDIWGVKQMRSMSRKFSDYLALMVICPVLVVFSSSLTVFITSQVVLVTEKVAIFGYMTPIILPALRLLPYVVFWVLLTGLYIYIPNTRVRWDAALLGGIVAGTLYQLVQWAYIHFQIGATRFGPIYGSFAALPLFLIWLQTSWLVVLFGAEISFARQNEETYEFEHECSEVSRNHKNILSLWITSMCVRLYANGEEALTPAAVAERLDAPIRLVRELMFELSRAGVLMEAKPSGNREARYAPARTAEYWTVQRVLDALAEMGTSDVPVPRTPEWDSLTGKLQEMGHLVETAPANIQLQFLSK